MILNKLVREYDEQYGILKSFKSIFSIRRRIVYPFLGILLSGVTFYLSLLIDNNYTFLWVLGSVLVYITSILTGIYMMKHPQKNEQSIDSYQKERNEHYFRFLREDLQIKSQQHFEILEKLINNEINSINETKKIPFSNTINQLLVAVLISGLLTMSFSLIEKGESVLAGKLIVVYMLSIGTLLIISSIAMVTRDFSKTSKYKNISSLLLEYNLEMISKK